MELALIVSLFVVFGVGFFCGMLVMVKMGPYSLAQNVTANGSAPDEARSRIFTKIGKAERPDIEKAYRCSDPKYRAEKSLYRHNAPREGPK